MDDEALVAMLYLDALSSVLLRARQFYGPYGDQILQEVEPLRALTATWLRQTVAAIRLRQLGDPAQLPLPFRPALWEARELLTSIRDWPG